MEVRSLKMMFQKSGSGSINTRLGLPSTWVREMGISESERGVIVVFDGEKIEIRKLGAKLKKIVGETYTVEGLRKELISLGYEDIFNIMGYEDCIFIDGDIIIEGKEGSAQIYFETEGRNIKVTDVVLP